ncbi:MAG: TRC40/GET3/ArsA family transport-energizing ATPase [Archaeoglobaceae archaeon]
MRIILFTGKGGVGKTTMAAASALKAASMGYRTLVMSADPAHNLSDCYQTSVGPKPKQIAENLYAVEIDVQFEIEKRWEVVANYLKFLFRSQGIDDIVAEELAIPPGIEELVSLLYLLEVYESGNYDVVILDCAPTGETLRLLNFPEVARWYMNRFFGLEKRLLKVVRPIAEPIVRVPLPGEDVLDAVQDIYVKIAKLKDVLESERTTVRLVLTPERIAINESERAFAYLHLFGYRVDCLIVNKVYPEDSGEFLARWVELQRRYVEEIRERFPVPVFLVKFKEEEVTGEKLKRVAEELYDCRDPTEIFYSEEPFRIEKDGEETVLVIKLPFLSKEQINLLKRGDEIVVTAGQWKRIIFLPQSLALKKLVGARFMNGELRIRLR